MEEAYRSDEKHKNVIFGTLTEHQITDIHKIHAKITVAQNNPIS